MSKLGEGTFGEVHKAESRRTGQIVAMKKILMHQEKDGFPVTALREIKLLKMLSHKNILNLEEMAVEKNVAAAGRKKAIVYMVTPYMDHDLSGLLENPAVKFTEAHLKCYMIQLLEGVAYLHAHNILHRDMKTANLLINNQGILKIADFGLARPYDDPPPQRGKGNGEATRGYTTIVVTRWYRPPELLLQLRQYTPAIDMWGVGCVFGEMFKHFPMLPGNSDVDQIHLIFKLIGTPTEDNMPGWTDLPGCDGFKMVGQHTGLLAQEFQAQGPLFISLMSELLKLDWRKRINAMDALEHPYFKSEPLPAKAGDIPAFQESHELDRRKFREQRANPPPAPAGGTVGMGPDGDFGHGHGHGHGHPPAGGHHYDRRNFGHPRNGHDTRQSNPPIDSRAPLPPPTGPPAPTRRPAWAQPANGLPPRPPPPRDGMNYANPRPYDNNRDRDRPIHDRGPRPGRDRGGAAPQVDTYIPSYSRASEARSGRDERPRSREENYRRDDRGRDDRRERDDSRRRSRSSGRDRERDRDRDRDRLGERNRELYRR